MTPPPESPAFATKPRPRKSSREINHWLTLRWEKWMDEHHNTIYTAVSAIAHNGEYQRYYVSRAMRRDNAVYVAWADPFIKMPEREAGGRFEAQAHAQQHENLLNEQSKTEWAHDL